MGRDSIETARQVERRARPGTEGIIKVTAPGLLDQYEDLSILDRKIAARTKLARFGSKSRIEPDGSRNESHGRLQGLIAHVILTVSSVENSMMYLFREELVDDES
jgi:hypothetical protein